MLNQLVLPEFPEVSEQVVEIPASEVPDSEITLEVPSEPQYCFCNEAWDSNNRKFMIHCDICGDWFHGSCINLNEEESKDIDEYHCPKCAVTHGPSKMIDFSSKVRRNRGLRCTKEFIEKLLAHKFLSTDEVILKLRGQALTLPWLLSKGFNRPIVIETVEALGMKLPPEDFTISDVVRYVGADRMVDVIDVMHQKDTLMSMKEVEEYFTMSVEHRRDRLLNLISLEFSSTNLSKVVEAPEIARRMDWVTNYWPSSQARVDEDSIQRPAVQKYCLISAEGSYTDFHVDFGGTSVWYHVLRGEKVFYLIEPTEENLDIYRRWMKGEMGDKCFLGDEITVCFKLVLKKGQTLLIPTGWIHAVYTPTDSLVFGGNFLNSFNMDLQLKVYDIEKKLRTPAKYLFPSFEATHWYAAKGMVEYLGMLNTNAHIPSYMIRGLRTLIQTLKDWMNEKDVSKTRREYIPSTLNCKKIISELTRELRAAEKGQPSSNHKESPPCTTESAENGHPALPSGPSVPPKEPLKICISRNSSIQFGDESSMLSPPLPGKIKLKLKKEKDGIYYSSGEDSHYHTPVPSPSFCEVKEAPRVKIRLSLSEGKAESIDCEESNTGSDALHIAESDHDGLHMDSESSQDDGHRKSHRKHHHKKHKKNKSGKQRHSREQNKALNDELAGTLDGLEQLFESSKFSERISQSEATSQAVKDSVAGMAAMKESILPKKKKHKKSKRSKTGGDSDSDSLDGITKVHQDNEYIYLPLAESDDEGRGNKRGKKKDDDESWSPRAKVGPVGHRETKSSRLKAKRAHVEKGLEMASEVLENAKKRKLKSASGPKPKKQKIVPSSSTAPSASSSSMDIATKTTVLAKKFADATSTPNNPKKPKKGMATPKQRLGKILKITKFSRY